MAGGAWMPGSAYGSIFSVSDALPVQQGVTGSTMRARESIYTKKTGPRPAKTRESYEKSQESI